MPLIKGASRNAAKENFTKLVMEGKSRGQALAIVYTIARNNLGRVSGKRQQEIARNQIFGPGVTIDEVLEE